MRQAAFLSCHEKCKAGLAGLVEEKRARVGVFLAQMYGTCRRGKDARRKRSTVMHPGPRNGGV